MEVIIGFGIVILMIVFTVWAALKGNKNRKTLGFDDSDDDGDDD